MAPSRYSLADIRRVAQRSPDTFYDRVFTRQVSIWFTWLCAPAGVSPNAVSLTNLFVGIGGCVLIGVGQSGASVVIGVLLIHLYAVLDSVDGELARLLSRGSLCGMFLEDLSAYTMIAAFPIAVSLYLLNVRGSVIALVIAVGFAALGRNAMPAVRRAVAQSAPSLGPNVQPTHAQRDGPRFRDWKATIDRTLLHHTNIRVVLTTLILLDVATGAAGAWVAPAFFVYMSALFAREAGIIVLALKSDLLEREKHRLQVGSVSTHPRATKGTASEPKGST